VAFAVANATFRLRRRVQGKADPHPPGFYADFVKYAFTNRG
jgi:hypothetical protein